MCPLEKVTPPAQIEAMLNVPLRGLALFWLVLQSSLPSFPFLLCRTARSSTQGYVKPMSLELASASPHCWGGRCGVQVSLALACNFPVASTKTVGLKLMLISHVTFCILLSPLV